MHLISVRFFIKMKGNKTVARMRTEKARVLRKVCSWFDIKLFIMSFEVSPKILKKITSNPKLFESIITLIQKIDGLPRVR